MVARAAVAVAPGVRAAGHIVFTVRKLGILVCLGPQPVV